MKFEVNNIFLFDCIAHTMDFLLPKIYVHQLRVAIIADRIAKEINLPENHRVYLVYAALLHDIGAIMHKDNLAYDDNGSTVVFTHARDGYELLRKYDLFKPIAPFILHHHDWWDGSQPQFTSDEMQLLPIESKILNLAEHVDRYLNDPSRQSSFKKMHTYLKRMSLKQLDPDLVEAFLKISTLETFWTDYAWPNLGRYFQKLTGNTYARRLPLKDIEDFSEILVCVLEQGNAIAGEHSRQVAKVAASIAKLKKLDKDEIARVYIAGLLHDLGKIAISNDILNKPGKLTKEEYEIVKQHVHYTELLLKGVPGLEKIAETAINHHEALDGSGYPYGHVDCELSREDRIVAVADVFSALSDQRSYHTALSLPQIKVIMQDMAKKKKLDSSIVNASVKRK